ncbi:MAG: hypothetical protein C0501_24570 [Isosphaera sp.]|nr:hypothetical protein [Isosphaera sp.]
MRRLAPALLLALAGCGSPTAPVEGVVVFADAPDVPAAELAGYVLTFETEGDRPESGTGAVGPDGRFSVSTFRDGDGALRGRQRVAIGPPVGLNGERPPSKILDKYDSLQKSGLTVEVGPGVNKVTLVVERRAKGK